MKRGGASTPSGIMREIHSIATRKSEFVSDWLGLASRGTHDIVQCDFCALISPGHFEEFCLPDMERQCAMLDTSIFHLDGPDAVRHLDMILEVKDLDAIQWIPGAGRPGAKAWLPMLRRIQKSGKSVFIHAPPQDVEEILCALSPRGLMIQVEGRFDTLEQAERFISSARSWSRTRRQKKGIEFPGRIRYRPPLFTPPSSIG